MQVSHRSKSDAVIPVAWSQERGQGWGGVGETGKRAVSWAALAVSQATKGSVLGLSLGLGAIGMAGVYMACIFENAKASALASLTLGSSVELAALPAGNGERMSGLTWGNKTVHTSNSFSIPAPPPHPQS